MLALVSPSTQHALGIEKGLELFLEEVVPCRVWGRAACPQFSFLQPILGQIHPLNQSKPGPAPAVRLGTGFASLLLWGLGALVPSWQEGAVRAKDRMGRLGNCEFPGTIQTEVGWPPGRDIWRGLGIR